MNTMNKTADTLSVMTIQDVADYLQFSTSKVYLMARQGLIPAARIGKSWRFKRDLIDNWISRSSEANLDAGNGNSSASQDR
jgi:excisionase family DNA binding protein